MRVFATGVVIVLVILTPSPILADPPFEGSVFITPDIITRGDPSRLTGVTYTGRGVRTIFDSRVGRSIEVNAYLFEARYSSGTLEFQVNPEFGSVDAARVEVDAYASPIGRMPAVLMSGVVYVTVNAGTNLFRSAVGGPWHGGVIIHTGNGAELIRRGFIEEVLFHEAAHVTLDIDHANAPGWRAAQEADGEFITDYARRLPDTEDVAESLLPYFALRYRPDRLLSGERTAIAETIPNRTQYFDELALDWSPYMRAVPALPLAATVMLSALLLAIGCRRRWR